MTKIDYIRKMFFEKGMNYAEIGRETGHDVKIVKEYIEKEDFSQVERRAPIEDRVSKLDTFNETIDEWLADDMKARRKQRHTAKRVFDRLKDLHKDTFDCSYKPTAEYVRHKKRELCSMVKKILKDGEREFTDGFICFKNHYGFQAAFYNPISGHEKG